MRGEQTNALPARPVARIDAYLPERSGAFGLTTGALARPTFPAPGVRERTVPNREVVARDAHHTIHKLTRLSTNSVTGKVSAAVSDVVEMANGLNFRTPNGEWQRTEPAFAETPEAFVAERGVYRVILSRNLGERAVDLRTPDGLRLASAPLSLAYFDPVDGRSLTLAVAQPVAGTLVGSNRVLYADAFPSPRASILYRYERGEFHQDLLLHEAPPARVGTMWPPTICSAGKAPHRSPTVSTSLRNVAPRPRAS